MNRKAHSTATGRRRSRETTMQQLRQSGLEVFSRQGFEGATTKRVAKHARVNEALISRYFGGKTGLLNAIILQCGRNLDSKTSVYASGRSLEEELANFLNASIKAASNNPAFIKLVLSRALLSPAFRRTITWELQGAGEASLLERLADYQARKVIDRSVDLNETVDILRLFIAGILVHRLALSWSGISTKRAIEQIARACACTLTSPKHSHGSTD